MEVGKLLLVTHKGLAERTAVGEEVLHLQHLGQGEVEAIGGEIRMRLLGHVEEVEGGVVATLAGTERGIEIEIETEIMTARIGASPRRDEVIRLPREVVGVIEGAVGEAGGVDDLVLGHDPVHVALPEGGTPDTIDHCFRFSTGMVYSYGPTFSYLTLTCRRLYFGGFILGIFFLP